jgi:hypothetical protein
MTVDKTNVGVLKAVESKSILDLTSQIQIDGNMTVNQQPKREKSQFRKIFCDRTNSPIFYKCMLIFICAVNVTVLCLLSTTKLPGDANIFCIIYGSGIVTGMMSSGFLIKYIDDYKLYAISMTLILVATIALYSGIELDDHQVYFLFAM